MNAVSIVDNLEIIHEQAVRPQRLGTNTRGGRDQIARSDSWNELLQAVYES